MMPREIRYAVRTLRRSPSFALTAVLTLTLTLGINVGIFSTLNALAFRRLSAPRPEELVRISSRFPTGQEVSLSLPMFRELTNRQEAVAPLIAWWGSLIGTVEAQGTLTTAAVVGVTPNFYSELGVGPSAGRLLLPSDMNLDAFTGQSVAVIGYGFWQRRYGGAPSAVGSVRSVEGAPFTIVGVAPRGFKGFGLVIEPDVTVPLTTPVGRGPSDYRQAGLLWLRVAGRLQSGITLEQARSQLNVVWPAIKADIIPPTHAGAQRENFLALPLEINSLATGDEFFLRSFTDPLVALQGLALAALLIGCLNLATLTLRRITTRTHDHAIRIALGARPSQAVRPIVVEGALIAGAAALCAMPTGFWASTIMTRMILPSSFVPMSLNTAPDLRVVIFTTALMLAAWVICGWLPAWNSIWRDTPDLLKDQTHSVTASSRLSKLMLVGQLALSTVLLTNAGLLVRSLERILAVDVGFSADDVSRVLFMPRPGVTEPPNRESYHTTLVENVQTLKDVRAVSIARLAPGYPGFKQLISPMSWEPMTGISAAFNSVSPGFFSSLQIPVIAGRDFRWTDRAQASPVAILSRALAQRLFPDRDPLGQRIRIGTQPYRQNFEVIGIVADARVYDPKDASSFSAHIPELQDREFGPGGFLIVRGHPNEAALQDVVQSVGPDFIRTIDRLPVGFARASTVERLTAILAAIFGLLTLLLAAVGVGGLFAYNVVLHTKEIAIRLALGAEPRRIVKSILSEGVLIALVGTGLGISMSVVSTGPVRALLFGVGPHDPVILIGAPALLAVVALAACLVAVRRAANVDAIKGLRVE